MKRWIALMMATCAAQTAMAAELDVTVENLTRGSYFTPLLVAAHPENAVIFESGQPASAELLSMAEGGDIAGLESMLDGVGAIQVNNPASGLLVPGASATAMLNTESAEANTYLSVTAMILPTNDGFVAANAIAIPTEPGTYVYMLNAYDSGTEANDEVRGSGAPGEAGFPVPPPLDPILGSNGTGLVGEPEGFVHIHRGVLGDTDVSGGASDIDSTMHRWLNPVAKLTIVVK